MINRKVIGLFGKTNSGKSSLLNALTGQEVSIVSPIEGTTTDTVSKMMELIPIGAIQWLDTAGMSDYSDLGKERMAKTHEVQRRVDLALILCESTTVDRSFLSAQSTLFTQLETPYLIIFTKTDSIQKRQLKALSIEFPQSICISISDQNSIEKLKSAVIEQFSQSKPEPPLIGNILQKGDKAILVCPIDSEAPKGRLILPQIQVLRDALDHNIVSLVTGIEGLKQLIDEVSDIALVVTDSQAFETVAKIIGKEIPLTSFSILLAQQKGDFETLLNGAREIANLSNNSKILIAETCTHNTSHEDIGRIKLPALLRRATGKKLHFTFITGMNFPSDLSSYSMVVHCGGCMINRKMMHERVKKALNEGVAITNYGLALAATTGILNRSVEPLGY